MEKMENLNIKKQRTNEEWEAIEKRSNEKKLERARYKEELFRYEVVSRLLISFEDSLKENGYSEDQIHEFREIVGKLSTLDREYLTATPWDMKNIYLNGYLKTWKEDSSIQNMVNKLIFFNKQNARHAAYHTSENDIRPEKLKFDPQNKPSPYSNGLEWVVKGTEKDHRFDDQLRAYISWDYYYLFRNKNPKYLYIVNTDKSTKMHKEDNWGSAPSFGIIDKINLKEIDDAVEKGWLEHEKEERERMEKENTLPK